MISETHDLRPGSPNGDESSASAVVSNSRRLSAPGRTMGVIDHPLS